MNKIEKQFKKDFEESNKKIELTFDVSQLTPNAEPELTFEEVKIKKKNKRKIIIACVSTAVVLTVIGISLSQMLEVHSSVTTARRRLSVNASALAESNSVRKLNDISFVFLFSFNFFKS